MSQDKVFPKGFIAKQPRSTAPGWIKANVSIKREELAAWLTEQEGEWVNIQICEAKTGKWYAEVDTWKPEGGRDGR